MSYILEALRKAEQKREQEEPSKVPTFLTGTVRESGRHVRWWAYVLAAALLLNFGLLARHLVLREPPGASARVETRAKEAPEVVARATAQDASKGKSAKSNPITRKETSLSRLSGTSGLSGTPSKPAAVTETGQNPETKVEQPESNLSPWPLPANEPSDAMPKPQVRMGKARPAPSGKVFSLNELPPAIRSGLPEFRVSGHAYGPEPQTRVVRINEKILQEGQELIPGLRVEEIVMGGVIMSYEGYRFRIDVKEN